jgi:hypothetical protein
MTKETTMFLIHTQYGFFCDCRSKYGRASDEAASSVATDYDTLDAAANGLTLAQQLFPESECHIIPIDAAVLAFRYEVAVFAWCRHQITSEELEEAKRQLDVARAG